MNYADDYEDFNNEAAELLEEQCPLPVMLKPDTIRENRVRAVEALRKADESKRLRCDPLELDDDGNITRMCACAVISQALGLPMFARGYAPEPKFYNYTALTKALGLDDAEEVWGLNDAFHPASGPNSPLYTFAEIGDIKARDWGLE